MGSSHQGSCLFWLSHSSRHLADLCFQALSEVGLGHVTCVNPELEEPVRDAPLPTTMLLSWWTQARWSLCHPGSLHDHGKQEDPHRASQHKREQKCCMRPLRTEMFLTSQHDLPSPAWESMYLVNSSWCDSVIIISENTTFERKVGMPEKSQIWTELRKDWSQGLPGKNPDTLAI